MPERRGRLLLISPAFHGYCHSIARGFSQLGWDTVVHRYDAFDTVAAKTRNKLLYELPARFGADSRQRAEAHATRTALRVLQESRPDRVLVIKGDALGAAFWERLERTGVPWGLWLYDDLARHRYTRDFLVSAPGVISYARTEAQCLQEWGAHAIHLPNAFDPDLAQPPARRTQEIVFVGSRYPNRVQLLEHLHAAGVPVRAYGRQWSRHWWDRARTWELHRPNLPAERDVPLSRAYAVQAGAAGALNVHGLQAGLAMRTFEVPGMGGIQLIDRPDVAEFYDPGTEVLVYRDRQELLGLARRLLADPGWAQGIREAGRARTLAEHTFRHRARTLEQWWA